MRIAYSERAADARESVRPDVPTTDQMVGSVAIDLAYFLWPKNTAPSVADEIGCTVRTAERYLGGQRDGLDHLIAVVVAEIMRRHGARNLKVKAKRT